MAFGKACRGFGQLLRAQIGRWCVNQIARVAYRLRQHQRFFTSRRCHQLRGRTVRLFVLGPAIGAQMPAQHCIGGIGHALAQMP